MVTYRKRTTSRRVSRKRRSPARRKPKASTALQSMHSLPFPRRKLFRTRYVERQLLLNPSAAGAAAEYVFNLGSLYDPNVTAAGHQPLGFDQMMLMYEKYCVIGAIARITACNQDTSYMQTLGCYLNNDTAANSDIELMMEQGRMRYVHLAPSGTGENLKTLSVPVSMKKFHGVRNILDETDFQGSVSSSPARGCYLHVTVAPNAVADASTVSLSVQIDFVAILRKPVTLAQS